jgi:tetratricopeptide (TPR) repeat protein
LILAPVSGLTHVGIQLVADRYSYHSLIPFVPLLSIGILELHRTSRRPPFSSLNRAAVWCLFVLVLIALGSSTASYASKWKDQFSLWTWCIHTQESYGTYFQRASAYLNSGELDLALADAEKVVEHAPRHFNGWLMQAGIHGMKKNRQKALHLANRLVWLDDDTGIGYRERGKIRFALGMYEEASRDLAEATSRDPESAEASVLLGRVYSRLARHEEAVRALEMGLELGAEEGEVLPHLANARFQLGRFDAALEAVAAALGLGSTHPDLYLIKGQALLEKGDGAGAREALSIALETAPSDWPGRPHVESLMGELSK